MSKIRVLPEFLANKIAAGEVVERPASVVKELLENSIDAGARSIEVEAVAGGKRMIRIEDDGEGMSSDDALLAFERHATSKLQRSDDLMEIATLGFRGEALPSIASVSRLVLETRSESGETGSCVEIAGGRMQSVKEIARSRGTTVTVRDLFFNIPARKKFLKSESTELGHIVNCITQYALAHPESRFLLRSAGSELFHFQPVTSAAQRVFQVMGGELANQLIEVQSQVPVFYQEEAENDQFRQYREEIRVSGFVSKPEVHKLNRNSLFFFVNRRMVRDKILLHALNEAYRNILPAGIFPVAILFLEMPFREVDVNVHPSKVEVRFRHQSLVHDLLRDTVRKSLMQARPQASFPAAHRLSSEMEADSPFDAPAVEDLPLEATTQSTPSVGGAPPAFGLAPLSPTPSSARLPFGSASDAVDSLQVDGPGTKPKQPLHQDLAIHREPAPAGSSVDERALQSLSAEQRSAMEVVPLGQIDNSFIVAADRGALLLIDQHVAHERILFEKVLKQRETGGVQSQRLLLPILIELTPRQQVILENIMPELESCGFEAEPFGRKTIAVKAAPADLSTADVQRLLPELLEGLDKETQALNLGRLREKIAASIACHAAIKVNTPLDQAKMRWLIDALYKTQYPMSCPHGRPIVLRYERHDILKAFKRI
ncbi:MAG: DNA mismatch repair endonuclease MutL [Acidobacteriota bacterium]